jgi:hypothetical protein
MFTWITDIVNAGEGTAPIADIVGVALEAPFVYFIGLTLLAGAIIIIKSVIKR